ncbi:hypothetical protein [Mariniluteicoccus flavus]
MVPSGLALAAGLAALVAARARVRGWWRAAAWAAASLLVAWVVGNASLVRAVDPALLTGVPSVRPLVFGGWAGAALAVIGALRARRDDRDHDDRAPRD